jgi:hypothetical protein
MELNGLLKRMMVFILMLRGAISMSKLLFLTALFSCATTQRNTSKDDARELAVCKNTLQQGIHRNECMR